MTGIQTYEAWKQAIIDHIKLKGNVADPVIYDSPEYRAAYAANIRAELMYGNYMVFRPHFDTCEARYSCTYPKR